MAEVNTKDPQLEQVSAETVEQLQAILSAYNDTTNRLHDSYQQLKSEVTRLREQLRQKNEQLERKSRLAALGEMAAGMAHEIRNPLGGVQLYASLLEDELKGQDGSLRWVRKIASGVRTLDTIVTDILAFTQDQDCQKTDVNFMALLTEVMDYVRPQLNADDIIIDLAGVNKEMYISVDVNMFKRVMLNLLLNAVDAIDASGRIWITTDSQPHNSEYETIICIRDSGPGIDADLLSKIFNPFFTTKDTGTGLGLAIVHRLVECHGGMITAANHADGGACFTILLP